MGEVRKELERIKKELEVIDRCLSDMSKILYGIGHQARNREQEALAAYLSKVQSVIAKAIHGEQDATEKIRSVEKLMLREL